MHIPYQRAVQIVDTWHSLTDCLHWHCAFPICHCPNVSSPVRVTGERLPRDESTCCEQISKCSIYLALRTGPSRAIMHLQWPWAGCPSCRRVPIHVSALLLLCCCCCCCCCMQGQFLRVRIRPLYRRAFMTLSIRPCLFISDKVPLKRRVSTK